MDDGARHPVPQAPTAGEYVALLRGVRLRSGLTYREITRRASAAGHWLPPSTLATMLGRTTLPRERTVVALLTACGTSAGEMERWVRARREIEARLTEQARGDGAARTGEVAPGGPGPAAEPVTPDRPPAEVRRPARSARRLRLGVLALLGVLSVGASGALLPRAARWVGRTVRRPTAGRSCCGRTCTARAC
ncbi:helix-turn-helix domain-containing protein [Micromonospora sp. NPDC048170]|uniref:helix-turn-helix domain-containing protein n=1 Tax=Micromonospora sp. NPDC048170 TaxID=3154819 RepID=UPI0033D3B438